MWAVAAVGPGAAPASGQVPAAQARTPVAAVGARAGAAQAAGRPNILVILADDLGFSDIGCYGSEIATPNLDRLAAGGLRFSRFYNAARCCPTRACLLTGLYPHQAGVGDMVGDRGVPSYQGRLNNRCVTIAEVLRAAGYRTYMSGKWHVGENRPGWPVDRGFERSYALVSGGTNYFRLDPGRTLARDDKPITPEPGWYVTDAISDNAVAFLTDHGKADKPFLLYLAYTAPHWPLHAPAEVIAKYRGKYKDVGWDELRKRRHERLKQLGLVDPKWPLSERGPGIPAWADAKDKDDLDLRMAVYAAQIDRMDQGVGRVLAKLGEIGAAQNTLVLFLADNGACHEVINRGTPGVPAGGADSFFSYGVAWANAGNTPFRMYKHWVHEGGIASPLIAYWPAVIRTPGITHQVGHVVDLMATFVDLAGADYPKSFNGNAVLPTEGRSLAPVFEGKVRPDRGAIYWEHEGNKAILEGDWKLVAKYRGDWELYNLSDDRTETRDLAADRPGKVKELRGLWTAWAQRVGVVPWEQLTKTKKKAGG